MTIEESRVIAAETAQRLKEYNDVIGKALDKLSGYRLKRKMKYGGQDVVGNKKDIDV